MTSLEQSGLTSTLPNHRTAWTRPALWAALAVAGQAASLRLIDAGPVVRYQHYKPFAHLIPEAPVWALAVLGIQAAAVGWSLVHLRHGIRAWLAARFKPWQVVLICLAFVLTSATLSREPTAYLAELALATAIQLLHLGTVVLAVVAIPRPQLQVLDQAIDRLLGPTGESAKPAPRLDRFALGVAVFAAAVSYLLCVVSYQRHPHVPDELIYLLPARYFAIGRLALPLPPIPEAFDLDLMFSYGGKWFSPVPPGWPALLAVGAALGVPWLVNPLLSGLNLLLCCLVLQELYDRRTARLSVLLLAASPWQLFMAMNLMTHTFTLTCALAAALGVARWRRTGRWSWALLGGAATGVTSLIRPLEGLAVAGLLGLWAVALPGWGRRLSGAVAFGIGTALTALLVLPYNAALMGSPGRFPIMAYTDQVYGPKTNALGFGPERGLGWSGLDPLPGHGLPDVLINANFNLFTINTELFGWATGSLLIIIAFLLSGRLRRNDYLLIAAIVGVAGIHTFYWFSGGPDFAARYWYLVIVPCAALTARGLEALGQPEGARDRNSGALTLGALALSAMALAVFVPWRAADKYYHYRRMRPDIRELAREHHFGRSLVLIQGRRHPDYASAATYNPLDLDANQPVYAWDRSPDVRQALLRHYSDRSVWIIEGPTVTGDGYRVVAGPLPPASALEYPP